MAPPPNNPSRGADNDGFGDEWSGSLRAPRTVDLVTDWLGDEGKLLKLNGSYRGMNKVHEDIICNGKVTKKYVEEGRNLARVEVWAENPQGEKTVTGAAMVALPSKA